MAADSEISLLTRGATPSKATCKTWSSQPVEEEAEGDEEVEKLTVKVMPPEGGVTSPQLGCFDTQSSSIHEVSTESRPAGEAQPQLNLSFEVSQTSVRSVDTTQEYYDATLPEQQEGEEVVTRNMKSLTEKEEPEEQPSPTTEQTPLLTDDLEGEKEQEAKEEETFEVMETGLEQEAEDAEDAPCENVPEQEAVLTSKQEDAEALGQEDTAPHSQGNSIPEFPSLPLTEPGYRHM